MAHRNPSQYRFFRIYPPVFVIGVFVLLVSIFLALFPYARISAAQSTELNYQARLLTSSGHVADDGSGYGIVFNLYTAVSGGTAEWTETQSSIRIVNGYLSVKLGSVTPFPSTIDWSTEHWITMNVNGDGEMLPRMKMNAVPYAFRAKQADGLTNGSGTVTADGLLQKAPLTVQLVTSTDSGLRMNQTGSGGLVQLQGNGSDVFTVAKNGDTFTAGALNVDGATLDIGTTSLQGGLLLQDGSGKKGTLKTRTSLALDRLYTLPDASGEICLDSGNCSSALTTLQASYNGSTPNEITLNATNGGLTIVDNATPLGTNLFEIKNNSGATTYFAVNSTGASVAGSVTATSYTGVGAVTYGSGGSGDLTLDSASNVLVLADATIRRTAAGTTGIQLNDTANTTLSITNTDATAKANLNVEGAVTATSYTGDGSALTGLSGGSLGAGSVPDSALTSNVALLTTSQTFSGAKIFGAGATVTTGQFLTVNGDALSDLTGTGLQINSGALSVIYGGLAGNSVQGNQTVVCPSGTGNLTGGGTTITLGTGGTCANLSTNNAVSFSTSVTSPVYTGVGAVTYGSGGVGDVTIDSASNKLVIAASDTTLQRTAAGTYTIDLNDTSNTILALLNSGTGLLNLTTDGTITAGNGLSVTTGGASISGAINNNNGGITSTGSIAGATTISLSGSISGGTTYGATDTTAGTSLSINKTNATGSILNLANNGTTVTSVSNTGDVLFKTTTNSANALRVQNAGGVTIFGADTTGSNQNNLITNSSFESSTTSWAAKGTTPTTFAQDSGSYYDALNSLKITTQAVANQGAQYAVTLTNSTAYAASFYIKLDQTSNTMATLAAGYSSDGATDNTACTMNTNTVISNGWTRVNCSFTTPASNSGTPYFYIKQTDGVIHTFYIDAVLLQLATAVDTNYRDSKLVIQGVVTTPLILQNNTNSTNAFAVQNSIGTNIFSVDTTDTNIIQNPGFEATITGWAPIGGTTTTARDASASWLGTASLGVTTSTTANAGAKYTTGSVQPTQLAISSTYTISWYAKLASGTFTDIIAGYDRDGSGAGVATACAGINNQTVLTTGWKRFSCTILTDGTAPAVDAYVQIVQTAAPGAVRTFYIDAVQLEGGTTATDYGAGSIFINGTINSPVSFKNKDNSTSAFVVQNAAATPIFQVDTLNNALYVGNPTADSIGTILVLDNKNTAGDPATGVNGAEYYNSAENRYRCYRGINATAADGAWEDCGTDPIDHSWSIQDDFVTGGIATNTIGNLNWALQTITTTAVASYNNVGVNTLPPTSDRPGIFRLRTSANVSRGSTMTQGGSNLPSLIVGVGTVLKTSVGTYRNGAVQSPIIRIGMHNETITITSPTAGVWFEIDTTTNANVRYCYGNGAGAVCANSTIAVADTTWLRLEYRVTSSTAIDYFINGTKFSVSSITLDTSTLVAPAVTVFSSAAVAQDFYLDYYQLRGGSGTAR